MKDSPARTIHLADYAPFGFIVDHVALTFRLAPDATRVLSAIRFRPDPAAPGREFFLHGENLRLISARIDGQAISARITPEGLSCDVPDQPFLFEAEVEISPDTNTALEGLYMSRGMYSTQCEAEGFRKITYYPDRPDVMARFDVRIEGDLPVLLSNGNPGASGPGWAEWSDPWPKPAYLFALVAGDLRPHRDTFTTIEGREVALAVWVRPGDEDKCAFAMESLKRAMVWDEQVYGRAYDLDVFNIVAVDDFNMGAMENKGLNIFNSAAVLASPATSTDANYERIESIIAHEYFHNWTGNRITCRDWFQLCLKEGLTVYRDQMFSGDLRGHAVKRIGEVSALRARQFREDAGPLAHPVRPESFVEINNFYTATVYEKGAELIGMLRTLVGDAAYYQALDLYFTRHDGQAATIEDWLRVFEDVTGRDLRHFKRWYAQAGTPRLSVREDYADGTYTLHFTQTTPPTPGQPDKAPLVIPIALGLLGQNGDEILPTTVLEMTEAEQSFSFKGMAGKPLPSILRGFSAPVILEYDQSAAQRAFMLAHDTDPFNRWEAGRMLAKDVLRAMIVDGAAPDPAFAEALGNVLRDDAQDPAFRAMVLALPGEDDMAQTLHSGGIIPDPGAIHTARRALQQTIATALEAPLAALYDAMVVPGPYTPEPADISRRALRLAALGYLSRLDGGERAQALFDGADNMTEQLDAFGALLLAGRGDAASAAFYAQWQHERLALDKWFSIQIATSEPDQTAQIASDLIAHPDFDWKNPNRFRAVIGALAMHPAGFHHPGGAGYRLLGDCLIRLDPLNPQTAARMSGAFETWRRYDADRQALMSAQLHRIAATEGLSRDTTEMVSRILGPAR
ncbi:MAG: aminopeptidase N [Paracoccaceae bacterium]